MTSNESKYPKLHRDGTVTYWSYFQQEWVKRSFYVPAEEIEALCALDRKRVQKHLNYVEAVK